MVLQDTRRPVVFHHIPKTGGTSFGELLARGIPSDHQSRSYNDASFVEERALRSGDFSYYQGHFSWATCLAIPNAKIITMLREPLRRVVSQYRNFSDTERLQDRWKNSEEGRVFELEVAMAPIQTMTWFLNHPNAAVRGSFSNVLVRSFLPFELEHDELRPDFYDHDLVELALAELETRVEWFGVIDDPRSTLTSFAAWAGLHPSVHLEQKNVSADVAAVTEGDLSLARRMNLMDDAFFARARALFYSAAVDEGGAKRSFVERAQAEIETRRRSLSDGTWAFDVLPGDPFLVSGWGHLEKDIRGTNYRWHRGGDGVAMAISGTALPKRVQIRTLGNTAEGRGFAISVNDTPYTLTSSRGGVMIFDRPSHVEYAVNGGVIEVRFLGNPDVELQEMLEVPVLIDVASATFHFDKQS